jgi:hypothetical protein
MKHLAAKILGIIIALLALIGLMQDGHAFGAMNVDMTLDVLRVLLAAALLYAGFKGDDRTVTSTLLVVGVLYVGMAIWGLADRTIAGMLPSGLTGFDIAFHLVVGAGAVGIALMPGDRSARS